MIPHTYPTNAAGEMIVAEVSPTDLTAWVDYIPVRNALTPLTVTNILDNTNDLTATDWTATLTPAPALNAVGLDGESNTASTLTDNDGVASEFVTQEVTITPSTGANVLRVFVKKDSDETRFPEFGIRHTLSDVNSARRFLQVNTLNGDSGVATSSGTGADEVNSWDANWWEVLISSTNNGLNDTIKVDIYPANGYGTEGQFRRVDSTGSAIIGNVEVHPDTTIAAVAGTPIQVITDGVYDAQPVTLLPGRTDGYTAAAYGTANLASIENSSAVLGNGTRHVVIPDISINSSTQDYSVQFDCIRQNAGSQSTWAPIGVTDDGVTAIIFHDTDHASPNRVTLRAANSSRNFNLALDGIAIGEKFTFKYTSYWNVDTKLRIYINGVLVGTQNISGGTFLIDAIGKSSVYGTMPTGAAVQNLRIEDETAGSIWTFPLNEGSGTTAENTDPTTGGEGNEGTWTPDAEWTTYGRANLVWKDYVPVVTSTAFTDTGRTDNTTGGIEIGEAP